MQNNEQYTIYIRSTKESIPVSKEEFDAYYHDINIYRIRQQRHGRCVCPASKRLTCDMDCLTCPFHRMGDMRSLDYTETDDEGNETAWVDEITDDSPLLEDIIIKASEMKALYARLTELMPEAIKIGEMRLEGLSEDAIGERIGIGRKTYAQMEKKVQDYGAEIERMEAMSAMEAQLNRPTSSPITEKPMNGKSTADEKPKTGRASDAYRTGMLTALRSNFHQVSDVLREGVDADGGYLVPEEYDSRLIQTLSEENIMRKLGHTITTSGEHKINIAATAPAAAWIEEGGALSFGDATFAQILLDAHKLHVAIKVTEELLYDNAFKLEDYILTEFGKALANAEEDAFLNGTGVGQPLGLFAETGGGHVAETLTAALKSDDLITLIHALKRPYRKSASFIMNDKTIAQIRKLKDNNGAYIWQPSYQAGEPDRILGYTVHTSAYAPENAIAFGDYSYYNIGDRGTRSFKQLNELFAGNGMIGFVAKERVDGKLILPEAVQILKLKTE